MKINYLVFITILLTIFSGILTAQSNIGNKCKENIVADYKKFYSQNNLSKLVLGIGYAAFYANTSFDQDIQDFYNDYIKRKTIDDVSKIVKPFGDGRITVPVYLSAVLIGELSKKSKIGSTIGDWGQRCSRSLLVGAPPVLALQIVLGASRPEEKNGSHWHPFKDNNGVSGHSFMGAVPFLTAAKMTDQRLLKYSFYLGSTLTGLSRINDNKHYFSQSFLGWWIAYLSVSSIKSEKFVVIPTDKCIAIMVYF